MSLAEKDLLKSDVQGMLIANSGGLLDYSMIETVLLSVADRRQRRTNGVKATVAFLGSVDPTQVGSALNWFNDAVRSGAVTIRVTVGGLVMEVVIVEAGESYSGAISRLFPDYRPPTTTTRTTTIVATDALLATPDGTAIVTTITPTVAGTTSTGTSPPITTAITSDTTLTTTTTNTATSTTTTRLCNGHPDPPDCDVLVAFQCMTLSWPGLAKTVRAKCPVLCSTCNATTDAATPGTLPSTTAPQQATRTTPTMDAITAAAKTTPTPTTSTKLVADATSMIVSANTTTTTKPELEGPSENAGNNDVASTASWKDWKDWYYYLLLFLLIPILCCTCSCYFKKKTRPARVNISVRDIDVHTPIPANEYNPYAYQGDDDYGFAVGPASAKRQNPNYNSSLHRDLADEARHEWQHRYLAPTPTKYENVQGHGVRIHQTPQRYAHTQTASTHLNYSRSANSFNSYSRTESQLTPGLVTYHELSIELVRRSQQEPWGFILNGGTKSVIARDWTAIKVLNVAPNTAAHGKLRKGDEILLVNGFNTTGMHATDVQQLFVNVNRAVVRVKRIEPRKAVPMRSTMLTPAHPAMSSAKFTGHELGAPLFNLHGRDQMPSQEHRSPLGNEMNSPYRTAAWNPRSPPHQQPQPQHLLTPHGAIKYSPTASDFDNTLMMVRDFDSSLGMKNVGEDEIGWANFSALPSGARSTTPSGHTLAQKGIDDQYLSPFGSGIEHSLPQASSFQGTPQAQGDFDFLVAPARREEFPPHRAASGNSSTRTVVPRNFISPEVEPIYAQPQDTINRSGTPYTRITPGISPVQGAAQYTPVQQSFTPSLAPTIRGVDMTGAVQSSTPILHSSMYAQLGAGAGMMQTSTPIMPGTAMQSHSGGRMQPQSRITIPPPPAGQWAGTPHPAAAGQRPTSPPSRLPPLPPHPNAPAQMPLPAMPFFGLNPAGRLRRTQNSGFGTNMFMSPIVRQSPLAPPIGTGDVTITRGDPYA